MDACWQYIRNLHADYKQSPSLERAQDLCGTVLLHCKYVLGVTNPTRSKRAFGGESKLDDLFKDKFGVGFKSIEHIKTKYDLANTSPVLSTWTQLALQLYDTDKYTLDDLKTLVAHLKRADHLKYEGRRLVAAIGARVFGTHSVRGCEKVTVDNDERMIYSWYQYFLCVGPSSENLVSLIEEQNLIGPGFDGPLVQWIVDQIEAKNAQLFIPGFKWWEDYEAALESKRAAAVDRVIATIPGVTDVMRNVYRRGEYGFPNGWSPQHVKLNIQDDNEFDVNRDICIKHIEDLIPRLMRLDIDTSYLSDTIRPLLERKQYDPSPLPPPSTVPFVPPSELRKRPEVQNYVATGLF